MSDALSTLDMFARGVAAGAMGVTALVFVGGGGARHARLATVMAAVSIIAWLTTESAMLWSAFGHAYLLLVLAYPVAGLFWLFVLTVFEDRPLSAANLAPAALLLATGLLTLASPPVAKDWIWAGRNFAGVLLCLHAALVIIRGWNGDLVEGRRWLRGLTLGFAALFGATNVVLALLYRLDPHVPWLLVSAGRPLGGAVFAALSVVTAVLFLQARPAVFGAARKAAAGEGRAEAADRAMLQKLGELMAGGAWRREGLTIGALAEELGLPEHRLRRLINQGLGHRNFADFVNAHRIEAAKQRLADPGEARTTVAALAFDLGYGSLGPFNRAFRAATGATPTEWRRQALGASPEMQNTG